jgi:hypothetical protein
MPKRQVDYSNSCIYKIVHKDDVDNKNIYIGSTSCFRNRRYQHKHSCENPNDRHHHEPFYNFIRENGGWNEWIMIEIEKYPCNDKREAELRERHWIEYYKSSLNKRIPTRTKQESGKLYWERIKEKPETKEKHKELWDKFNQKTLCECGCTVGKAKLKRHQDTAKHKKLMETEEQI